MAEYDKEFLDYMQSKYNITLESATHGSEKEIITFAVAWDVWKKARDVYSHKK
jgi:hypothetical protein